MAIAYVGSGTGSALGNNVVSYSSAGGNQLVAIISMSNAVATAVTDSAGNAWVQIIATVNTGINLAIWTTVSPTPAAVTTVTNTTSGVQNEMIIAEYSGVAQVSQTAIPQAANTTANPSTSFTLTAANNWAVVGVAIGSVTPPTAGTGNLRVNVVGGVTREVALVDNTAASATSVTTSVTHGANTWIIAGVELRPLATPIPTAIVQDNGITAGGTTVTITGTAGFAGFQTGATVTLDGSSATSVVVVNSYTITCVTPSHASTGGVGKDVIVTNTATSGLSGTLTAAFSWGLVATVGTGSTSASATSITLTYSSTAGNCLVLVLNTSGSLQAASAVVDSASNVWVRLYGAPSLGNSNMYICLNAAAITSVGLSGLTNTSHELMLCEYTGVVDWRVLATFSAAATSVTPSISSTLNAADNFLVAAGFHTGTSAGAYSVNTGKIRVQQASAATRRDVLIDNTSTTASSVTCSATIASQPWVMVAIELIPVQNLNIVNLDANFVNASQNTYTSGNIVPRSGDLIIIAAQTTSVTPAAYNKLGYPLATGCGLTFNVTNGSGANNATRKQWLLWAIADGSATSGAITFSFPTAPNNAFTWSIERVRGYDTTTPISWCVQIGESAVGTTSIHDPTLTLNALQDANSLVYGVGFSSLGGTTMVATAGWATLASPSVTTLQPTLGLWTMSKVNDNVVKWTNVPGTTTQDVITGIEITASNTNASNNPLAAHLLGCAGAGK